MAHGEVDPQKFGEEVHVEDSVAQEHIRSADEEFNHVEGEIWTGINKQTILAFFVSPQQTLRQPDIFFKIAYPDLILYRQYVLS